MMVNPPVGPQPRQRSQQEAERQLTTAEDVFDVLAVRIAEGYYRAGQQLSPPAISITFGISRTPVREALQRLSRVGLVESVASRRTTVSTVTSEEIRATRELTSLYAGALARMAVEKASDADRARDELHIGRVAAMIAGRGDWLPPVGMITQRLYLRARNPMLSFFAGDSWYRILRDLRREPLSSMQRADIRGAVLDLGAAVRANDPAAAEAAGRRIFGPA